ncbi:hypothetical protein LTR85_008520 [Meristemomyces frigidus]|nr:hypothetical protein LTR85_008520 [Meristemomyces frigidus]
MATIAATAGDYAAITDAALAEKSHKLTSKSMIVLSLASNGEDEADSLVTLKDLVRSSVVDNGANNYTGPPIGFATSIIHADTDTGRHIKAGHGAVLDPPRPIATMDCTEPKCVLCHPPTTTTITVHETVDGRLPIPNPLAVKGARKYVDCSDWLCGVCTTEANVVKFCGGA